MGVYASTTYDLTIPITEIGPILVAFREAARPDWSHFPEEWEKDDTPETLGDVIAYVHGNEDSACEVAIDGSDVRITGTTYGKVGDVDLMEMVLSEHGVTGITHGECEGEYFLTEFTGVEHRSHAGMISYPTYKGDLL